MVSDYFEAYARTMIVDERYLSQDELKYVYERAEVRMDCHPELAEKYRKIIDNYSFYTDKNTAIERAILIMIMQTRQRDNPRISRFFSRPPKRKGGLE